MEEKSHSRRPFYVHAAKNAGVKTDEGYSIFAALMIFPGSRQGKIITSEVGTTENEQKYCILRWDYI
jgi:hypothetical protein